ncbi:EndoU domain-containing protein, partial [Myxococcota bacterium]|nr:EndoU domain-containing protein [Myxococcota bacterium]
MKLYRHAALCALAFTAPLLTACDKNGVTQTASAKTPKAKKPTLKKAKPAPTPKLTPAPKPAPAPTAQPAQPAPAVLPVMIPTPQPKAQPVATAIDCAQLPEWTQRPKGPQLNQRHVFCGEWDERKGRAKGFHAQPGGRTPRGVTALRVTQKPDARGIYGGRWAFTERPGAEKFSTMFPDSCTQAQVIESILYAEGHRQPCPADAPGWAWCGPSKPAQGGEGYCEVKGGQPFIIAGASLSRGDINT